MGISADGEHLTAGLVVDAHVIAVDGYRGDCGPLGPHTSSCEGPISVQVAVSLFNESTTNESVPVVEGQCDGDKVASGTAPTWRAGDQVPARTRRTDTVTIAFQKATCPVPAIVVHGVRASDGDLALTFLVPLPV